MKNMKKARQRIKRILQNFRKENALNGVEKLELTIDSVRDIQDTFGPYLDAVLKETNTVDVKSEAIESGETAILKLPENQIKIKISMVK